MCPLARFGGFSAARMVSIQDPEREIHGQAQAVQRCLTCGSCEVRCHQGVRYTEFVCGLREQLPAEHRVACPHGEVFQQSARAEAANGAHARSLEWLDEDLRVAEEGDVGLFVGCLPLYDVVFGRELEVEMTGIANAAIRLLNRMGIEPVIAADESCCGHDLLWAGEKDVFADLARRNAVAFQGRGVKHLLTTCAECCRTWRLDYPQVKAGYNPKVEHLSEFLAPRIESGELAFGATNGASYTFHDPCRLGRHLGVFDAPRQVAEGLAEDGLLEMDRAREDALCCGTSGFTHCDAVSRLLQTDRLQSAADTGADTLITACPKCLLHFKCAQWEDQRNAGELPRIEIQDLTLLAESRLEVSES
jgi:Fe-S oxidoreductase